MNKTYLGIIAVILLIIAGVYSLVNKPVTDNENHTTPTSTEVATDESKPEISINKINPNDIELDLSKLQGKDRLYTEEEGRYENLSEEERRLLEKVRCPGSLFTFDYLGRKKNITENCEEVQRNVENFFRLVSLKGNIAVAVEPPDGMNSGWIHIYDIENDSRIETIMGHNYAFGPNYIVRTRPLYLIENSNNSEAWLDYYRPGMTDFEPILNSKPPSQLGYDMTEITFNENIFLIKVALSDCDEDEIGNPINCVRIHEETKTFDLSNLP